MTNSVCFLDWDGTLRKGYVIFEWTQYLAREGVIAKRFVESMENSFAQLNAGSINYEQMAEYVVQAYAESQKGLRVSDLEILTTAFAETNPDVFSFAAPLIDHLRQNEIEPIVITGSPTSVVEHFAQKIGVRRCYGLEIEVDRVGVFLGSCKLNLAVAENKRTLVKQLQSEFQDVRLALGNSGSDSPLLEVARCAYYITDTPGAASAFPELDVLIRAGKLREISPELLLRLVEEEQVLWR